MSLPLIGRRAAIEAAEGAVDAHAAADVQHELFVGEPVDGVDRRSGRGREAGALPFSTFAPVRRK